MVPQHVHSLIYIFMHANNNNDKELAKGLLTIKYTQLLENSEGVELVTWKLRRCGFLYKIKSSETEREISVLRCIYPGMHAHCQDLSNLISPSFLKSLCSEG